LRDISFIVEPGEKIALVGESGVGKSTLVELVSGYYFADKGQVLIDGHNVKNFDLKSDDVVYFEHNPEAVKSAQSVGIKTHFLDNEKDH